MQYTYYDPAIRRFIGADVLFDWAGLAISVIDLSHNLTDPLAYAGVACDVIDIFFPGCYTGEIVNTVKYSVRYGPDFVMVFISKFGDDATAMAVKHSDEVLKGGTKIADLSKTALKHPLNRHTPTRVAQQFKHMDKVSINKYLDEVSFFNKSWTEEQITEALNYGYKEALSKGVLTGEYSFK